MKITYNTALDILRILFTEAEIEESDEERSGFIIDYDKEGNIVGVEILDASKKLPNPAAVELAVVK